MGTVEVRHGDKVLIATYTDVKQEDVAVSGTPIYVGKLISITDEEGRPIENDVPDKLLQHVIGAVQKKVKAATGHGTVKLVLRRGTNIKRREKVPPYPIWNPDETGADFGQDLQAGDLNETKGKTQDGVTKGREKSRIHPKMYL